MQIKEMIIGFGIMAVVVGIYFLLVPSNLTGHATTDVQTGNLTVGVQTYMACTWSTPALAVDFGSSLNPGTNDINGSANYIMAGNGTGYNITVSALSTANADVTISGNNLADGGNIIEVENVTYQTSVVNNTDNAVMVPSGSVSINSTTMDMFTNVAPEGVGYYRLWLDIPNEAIAGTYVGNYTLTCEEA